MNMPSQDSGLTALVALVVQNTSLVICLKLTFRDGAAQYAASTVVLVSEIVKLLTCYTVYIASSNNDSLLAVIRELQHQKLLYVPSVLYVVQNNLLFFGAERLPSLIYVLCSQTKILTTAIMSRLILGTEVTKERYLYLVLLVFGIVIVQSQQDGQPSHISDAPRDSVMLGMTAVFLASLNISNSGRDPRENLQAIYLV